jgi:hypothetical protein
MVRAHGGSKDLISTQRGGGLVLGGILRDTTMNSPKVVHMRSLEHLVAQTTGIPRERPVMEGVIASTVPTHMRDVPELHPVHEMNKTDSKMAVGGTYSGEKSGYGAAEKSKKSSAKKHK